ncbi:unnamed protein product [Thlaspi arvense]|uniref:F-box domain-containing protein n=1 Tax=Thlaspi arvense TaxID=13288 RepID=A0AAU9RXM9_THLAR|nr:unnamed protein product [Thlaspi arvense]
MAAQLPWELEEEILSRLPPKSLYRFRIVCKRWNRVCEDKTFQNNHLSRSRPQFIFLTRSKGYSIDIINPNSIDPKIELLELHSSPITPLDYTTITTCDELLFYYDRYGPWKTLLWNPWLRQVKRIFKIEEFIIFGLGYDNSRPEKVYKIWGYSFRRHNEGTAIYDCASRALKFIYTRVKKRSAKVERKIVSLNGNLYWIPLNDETRDEHIIRSFDFSTESIKTFCLLPCQKNHPYDELLLAVFKRDGFSLLKQCYSTKKIEVWVTKNKIDKEEVAWIKPMTLPTSNLPTLYKNLCSYFIYDKTLFMCCGYSNASIYIVREDTCKKFQIQHGIGIFECRHCVSTPSLISVPLFSG